MIFKRTGTSWAFSQVIYPLSLDRVAQWDFIEVDRDLSIVELSGDGNIIAIGRAIDGQNWDLNIGRQEIDLYEYNGVSYVYRDSVLPLWSSFNFGKQYISLSHNGGVLVTGEYSLQQPGDLDKTWLTEYGFCLVYERTANA